ncbi:MAG: sugar ABC transporter ATP-binding protein [Actinomycetota bacterium]|nr:sugar ABC transporter ATP-binding protein [Actinomycetota bacterium]
MRPPSPAGGAPADGTSPSRATPRLSLHHVAKSFGAVQVLHGIELEIQPGEIHGLVGQNGAGKSTLARILAGGYPDHGGSVEIDGAEARLSSPREARRAGVAVIYQEFSLVPQLSVAENILLGEEPRGARYDRARVLAEAEHRLSEIGMADDLSLGSIVSTLSAAAQQRVEIAKALTRKAKVVVLDEPTARLAGPEREQLFALMRRVAGLGAGLVFISHVLDEVMAVTSQVTVLRDGQVVASGPTSGFDVASLAAALVGRSLGEEAAAGTAKELAGAAPLLRARALSGGRQVRDVSIEVRPGEILGMAGLVGSGRSTVARMLVGALQPSAGTIEINGEAVRLSDPRHALRHKVALVPEDRRTQGLVSTASSADNLLLMSLAASRSRLGLVHPGALRRRARQAVADFDVRPADDRRQVATLSGGNQQKVLFARAALARPDVLIVDQPTAGVDVGTKAEIHQLLRDLAGEGKGVLVISDDVDELVGLAHRIVVMRRGRLVAEPALPIAAQRLVELMVTGNGEARVESAASAPEPAAEVLERRPR